MMCSGMPRLPARSFPLLEKCGTDHTFFVRSQLGSSIAIISSLDDAQPQHYQTGALTTTSPLRQNNNNNDNNNH